MQAHANIKIVTVKCDSTRLLAAKNGSRRIGERPFDLASLLVAVLLENLSVHWLGHPLANDLTFELSDSHQNV